MTAGHKHREIVLDPEDWICRALRKPLFYTCNEEWVGKSIIVFGPAPDRVRRIGNTVFCSQRWYASSLGILHGLFGLTIRSADNTTED